ncbi:hypothetical protein SBD_2680 [Streptomyces bottropensis ATCC 25435]|uniref:Uncharacterized protein n=1 Tax=Streptomyces bottropensis ATCC 25435 TaxID=1054862 RepID=M3DFC6_9ACTN|nr:hypothetical protein SBD_2680 [Streptomyces bottropensis ATCC 25435]
METEDFRCEDLCHTGHPTGCRNALVSPGRHLCGALYE